MIKERVLKVLKENLKWQNYTDGNDSWDTELKEAVTEAIKLIEQQPSEDCVSRTQAIEWIENLRQMDKCFGNYEDDYFPLSEVIDRLKNVPPVTPTFPKGATNGDVIKSIFHGDENALYMSKSHLMYDGLDFIKEFRKEWWNTPYKRGNENEVD